MNSFLTCALQIHYELMEERTNLKLIKYSNQYFRKKKLK